MVSCTSIFFLLCPCPTVCQTLLTILNLQGKKSVNNQKQQIFFYHILNCRNIKLTSPIPEVCRVNMAQQLTPVETPNQCHQPSACRESSVQSGLNGFGNFSSFKNKSGWQEPADGSHMSHHRRAPPCRSGAGGGGGRWWRLWRVLWGILYWCLRVGPWRQRSPSPLHISSDLSSRMPCHPKHMAARGSCLASPSRTGLPSPISHSHNPPSPSWNCSPPSPFCCGRSSEEGWRNGSSSTAEEPRARVFPINIYSSFSQAPYLIACLLYHLHWAARASLRFFAELNVLRCQPRLLFELFLKFAECHSFCIIIICHVWTHWIERIKLQMAST